MNLAEGTRRIYMVFGALVLLVVAAVHFESRPTKERIAWRNSGWIFAAVADAHNAETKASITTSEVKAAFPPNEEAALAMICAKPEPENVRNACDNYKSAQEGLLWEQVKHWLTTLGWLAGTFVLLSLFASVCSWVYKGFTQAPAQPPSA